MWFCSLYSGSSGNCIYVGSRNANILIDAGLSGKKIVGSLNEIGVSPGKVDGILVTHEHKDHIHGVGVLSRMFNIPIYANNNTWEHMKSDIGKIKEENIRIIENDRVFSIGDIDIKSYSTPHDAADPVGYCFFSGSSKISIATDIGHMSENVLNNVKDSDLLLLESNHDVEMLKVGPYPYVLKRRIMGEFGHLSNEDAGKAILKLIGSKPMTVVLGHLSQQNNYPELAYRTVISVLEENGVDIQKNLKIDLADRYNVGTFFEVG
jgi:Metal-dependent hydrolases of the beta-lactamase superfamily I